MNRPTWIRTGILALAAVAACTRLDGPTEPVPPVEIDVALGPRFVRTPTLETRTALDLVRLRVVDADADTLVFSEDRTIELGESWLFDFTTRVRDGQLLRLAVALEFVDTDRSPEWVEFAGRLAFDLTSESPRRLVRLIEMGRGPLANLSLTGLDVPPGTTIPEGGTGVLPLDTLGAQEGQVVFYESTDTTVATIDSTGLIRAFRPGQTRLIVQAGQVGDTLDLTVGAVNLPTPEEIDVRLGPHMAYVTSDPFMASLSDQPAARAIRDALISLVAGMQAGDGVEAVRRFEAAEALWRAYGAGSDLRSTEGPQLAVIAIGLIFAADMLGAAFP